MLPFWDLCKIANHCFGVKLTEKKEAAAAAAILMEYWEVNTELLL